MKAFFYFFQCVMRNRVRQVIKKPYILFGLILFIALTLPSFFVLMRIDREPLNEIYVSTVTIMTILIFLANFLWNIYGFGIGFEPADINLLHTSPLSPGIILLFRKLRIDSLLRMIYVSIIGYAPFFTFNIGIRGEAFFIACISLIMIKFACVLLGVIWYASFEHKSSEYKMNLTLGALSIVAVSAIWITYRAINSSDPFMEVIRILNMNFISLIPVIGWYRHLFKSAVYGFGWEFMLAFLAASSSLAFLFWYTTTRLSYRFYEDSVKDSKTIEVGTKTDNKSKVTNDSVCAENRGKLKAKSGFTMKGAGAIFQKHLLEYGKNGLHLITTRTYIYPLLINAAVFFIPDGFLGVHNKLQALCVSIFLSFMFSAVSLSREEIDKYFIYLIPDCPFRKLYMAAMTDIIKNMIDGAIMFFVTAIFFRTNIWGALLCAIIYCMFNVMFYHLDVIAFYLYSRMFQVQWGAFLRLLFYFVVILPAFILVIALSQAGFSYFSIILVLIASSAIIAFLLSVPAANAIKRPEAA